MMFCLKLDVHPKQRRAAGFTLLEMMICVALLVVISLASASLLRTVLDARGEVRVSMQDLRRLQLGMMLIRRDVLQAVPGRDLDLHLGRNSGLAGYRFGANGVVLALLNADPQWGLVFVRYRYDEAEQKLWREQRLFTQSPDDWSKTLVFDRFVLDEINFYDGYGWSNAWGMDRDAVHLPTAVEWVFSYAQHDAIRLLIPMMTRLE